MACWLVSTLLWDPSWENRTNLVCLLGATHVNILTSNLRDGTKTMGIPFTSLLHHQHRWLTNDTDYGYNTTVPAANESLSQGALIRWYLQRMWMVASHVSFKEWCGWLSTLLSHAYSNQDRQAASAWWHVIMFLAPGIDYFQPGIVLKVLWSCLMTPSFEKVAGYK
jgi:hypothetical protein